MSEIKKFVVRDKIPQAERDAFIKSDRVDQCLCFGAKFVELLAIAREHNLTAEELIEKTGVGGECETCIPYIHHMVKTGETDIKISVESQAHLWVPDREQGLHPIDKMFENRPGYPKP